MYKVACQRMCQVVLCHAQGNQLDHGVMRGHNVSVTLNQFCIWQHSKNGVRLAGEVKAQPHDVAVLLTGWEKRKKWVFRQVCSVIIGCTLQSKSLTEECWIILCQVKIIDHLPNVYMEPPLPRYRIWTFPETKLIETTLKSMLTRRKMLKNWLIVAWVIRHKNWKLNGAGSKLRWTIIIDKTGVKSKQTNQHIQHFPVADHVSSRRCKFLCKTGCSWNFGCEGQLSDCRDESSRFP